MASSGEPAVTVVDGRRLRLTSLHKVMYPVSGTTKQEVLSYYAAVAPHLVRHARMRLATRKRYIDGVGTHAAPGKVFFEKNLGSGVPDWVPRRDIEHEGRAVTYPLLNEPAVVVWCAQLGALELHVPQWMFTAEGAPANPDRLVLDLDPGPGADLDACVEVALLCRAILDDVGLESVPVTSGSKGIHLYAQLDGTQTSQQASSFAHRLALALEADHPKLIVSDMKKSLRGGKVLLDWSQNNAAKTTIAPYSLRGTMRPQVACPRRWDEVAPGMRQLEMYEVLERLERDGDALAALAPSPETANLGEPPARRHVVARALRRGNTAAAAPVSPPGETRLKEPAAGAVPVSGSGAGAPSDPDSSASPADLALRPMLARSGTAAQVDGDAWAYEVKWDGYRALVRLRDGAIRLTSRNGIDLTGDFPELQSIAPSIAARECVLDGEIVVLDESGRPRFDRLQERGAGRAQLMLFDALRVDGVSLLDQPYTRRREILELLVSDAPLLHVPPCLPGTASQALATSRELRLEGVVAKRRASKYVPGARSVSWVKLKNTQSQEVIVIGWTPGAGNRRGSIGALLLAVPIDGDLTYVGKVGSGFSDRALIEAADLLRGVKRASPPIDGVPLADSRDASWVEPAYVGEVTYAQWTDSRRLRHPVWKGWRRDKAPADVRVESPS